METPTPSARVGDQTLALNKLIEKTRGPSDGTGTHPLCISSFLADFWQATHLRCE